MESLLALAVFVGLPLGAAAWGVVSYNRLVGMRNAVANQWTQIDIQLKRRKDLIPNLVAAVQGYMTHEREALQAVVEARAKAVQAGHAPTKETIAAEGELGAALSRLMSVTEAYPDLKANDNVRTLMEEVASTENRIGFARQGYNDAVESFNTRIASVPDVFVNNAFLKAQPAEFWRVEDAERVRMEYAPPVVSFGRG